jgi:hypothetical protein
MDHLQRGLHRRAPAVEGGAIKLALAMLKNDLKKLLFLKMICFCFYFTCPDCFVPQLVYSTGSVYSCGALEKFKGAVSRDHGQD